MEFRVLALGDVTSEDGTRHLARTLRPFQKVHGVDFTVVNGENVSGVGLTPDQAEDLFAAGARCHHAGQPHLGQNADR